MSKTIFEKIDDMNKKIDELEKELNQIFSVALDTEVYVAERKTERTFTVSSKEDAREMYRIGSALYKMNERLRRLVEQSDDVSVDYIKLYKTFVTEMRSYIEAADNDLDDKYI